MRVDHRHDLTPNHVSDKDANISVYKNPRYNSLLDYDYPKQPHIRFIALHHYYKSNSGAYRELKREVGFEKYLDL